MLESWASGDLAETYGVVNIPVCDLRSLLETAWEDVENEGENPNYP